MSEINTTDAGKALVNAAGDGRTEDVRRLLAGMDETARRKHIQEAMEWAAWQGEAESVRLLLEAGVTSDPDGTGLTKAFHAAAMRGKVEVLRLLLDAGAELDARDIARRTALHHVARLSNFASKREGAIVARLLLEHRADVNAEDKEGLTPLLCACLRGLAAIVQELLAHGADPNAKHQYNNAPALLMAAFSGNIDSIRVLLDSGADARGQDRGGQTVLHCAARKRNQDADSPGIIRLLVERGADVMARTTEGATPLHWAALVGNVPAIEVLIEAGAEVNANAPDVTPLRVAIEERQAEAALTLIRHGATVRFLNGVSLVYVALREGMEELTLRLLDMTGEQPPHPVRAKTALMLAAEKGFLRVVDALLALGADPNIAGPQNRTALMYAAGNGKQTVVRRLLEAGANPNLADTEGHTALDMARRRRRVRLTSILEAATMAGGSTV